MPRPSRRIPPLRLLAALLALAGCAAPAPLIKSEAPIHSEAPVQSVAPGTGTIVAMRPSPPATPSRRSVLAALGVAPGAAPDGTVEFIVRGDDGQPISVMQSDAGDLHTGDRVALISGSRLRIAPVRVQRAAP